MSTRWPALVGGVVALIIHAAVAMALLWHEPQTGAIAPGTGGIEIGLGQAGGTAPGAESIEPANVQADQVSESVDPVEPAATQPVETTTDTVRASSAAPAASDAEEVASNQAGASGRGGQSGQSAGEGTGPEDDTGAGGDPGVRAGYMDRIQAHLAHHKEYPRRARQQRDEGVTEVTFTFNRAGEILDYQISAASDHPTLERATRRMMERANPLPAMPDAVPGEQMTLTVPVAYRLPVGLTGG